ncbi:GNAT family N-acetyltransferase [Streptomyces sp. LP05-1]|uniref:GNAT family N-acetyltransferase n=1 Tax=Streptomyces pyxinae TaxID=2970734 RepID=A0ABT2CEU1_9ACTN|nr:GNAT family protein [Streptomyces sp. LP05-1]MCS0635937.1 GNAT family N-acetyltransferase [Streptomyces sp. LP05-1]
MNPVSRRGPRLRLRELRQGDTDAVLAIYGSDEATAHLSFGPRTREQVRGIVQRSLAAARENPRSEYALAVIGPVHGDPGHGLIGFARLASDPHQPRAATMGFALRPDVWGRGYGLETVHLLLGLAFAQLDLHRVWGARAPDNIASARTMSAAGMVEEGTIREHINKNGRWRDSVVHAILEREWQAPVF